MGGMKVPRVTASTPPTEWPVALTVTEVAILLNRSPKALANRVAERKAWPPPVITDDGRYLKPIRWSRDTVAQYLAGTLADGRRRFRRRVA